VSVSLFKNKAKKTDDIPAPGTPPTWDENGVLTDPGNPWIGPMNHKVGYPTEGYSQEQMRRIRRGTERRVAAEGRVATSNYAATEQRRARFVAFREQRGRILRGEVKVSPQIVSNILVDEQRRASVTKAFDTLAQRKDDAESRREDRLDARRIARFKAGKPRGKDLREDVMNQYSSFLPDGYWLRNALATDRHEDHS
jgi:hypothetical protein